MKRKLFLIPALMLAGLLVLTGCPPIEEDQKPPVVNTDNLQAAISDAERLISNTAVSTDGKNVMPRDKWVTQAAVNELNGAISIAKAALSGTQNAVDAMTETLKTAIGDFEKAQKDGLKDSDFDLTDLADLIYLAESELAAAEVKDNGDEVNPASFWITQADKTVLENKISAANDITATNSQAQIDTAYNELIAALRAIKPGSSTAESKSNLLAAIGDAGSVKTGVAIDTAKENVSKGALWATQAQMNALNAAIPPAQAVYDNPNVTKKTVDDAITALNNAINTFETALTANGPGTKETPASDQLSLGIDALKNGNYDQAIIHFNNAYTVDNTSQEAILYSSLAMLASIPVDSKVRSFMSDRLGIKDYPATLNGLIDVESWMSMYDDERLLHSYQDQYYRNYNWYDHDDYYFFDNYPYLERRSGYYRHGTILIPSGITTKRSGSIVTDHYWAAEIDKYVNWYDYNPDTYVNQPGYYYQIQYYNYDNDTWNYEYRFYSSERKMEGVEQYYDWGLNINFYWVDAFSGNDLMGFTGPGYYSKDWGYSFISGTAIYETQGSVLFPNFDVPSWFSGTKIYTDSLTVSGVASANTMALVMMANLIEKNTNGLNLLLDGILDAAFGASFEAAYTRAQTLTGNVLVGADLLEAFGLDFIFEGGDIEISKAELNILFAFMRIFKASLEWITAYDWDTDINFLKHGQIWNDFTLPTAKPASLPFRNNFLKARSNSASMMQKSRDNYVLAINDAIASYDFYIGSLSNLPGSAKETLMEYMWVKDAFVKLRTAISTGGTFWLNEDSFFNGDTYINSEDGALFGVNFGLYFTPGYLAINKLIEPAASDPTRPEFYGFCEIQEDFIKITNRGQMNNYSYFGFKLLLEPLTEVFGFKFRIWTDDPDYPNGDPGGRSESNEEYIEELFLDFFSRDMALIIWDWYH